MTEKQTEKPSNHSSDASLTRQEFIKKVVKGAAVTGGLLAAPKVLDKFMLPAYAAGTSSCNVADTGGKAFDAASGKGFISIRTLDTYCVKGSSG